MTDSGAIILFIIFSIFYVISLRCFKGGYKIGRLKLLGSLFVTYILVVGVSLLMQQYVATAQPPDPGVFFGVSFLTIAAAATVIGYIVAKRMNDIGLSFSWGLLGLVPLVNVAFLLVLLALPSDFRGWQSNLKTGAGPISSQPERLKEYEQEFVLRGFLQADPKDIEFMAKGIYETFGHRNTKRIFRLLLQRSGEAKTHRGEGGERDIAESLLESLSAEESDGTELGKLMTRGEYLNKLVSTRQSLEDQIFDLDNGINWLVELAEDRIGLSARGAEDAIFGLLAIIEALVPKDQAERFVSSIRGAPEQLLRHKAAGFAVFGINPSWIEHAIFSRGIGDEQAKRLANLILEFVAKRNPDVALAVEVQVRGRHPLFSHPELGNGTVAQS